MKISNLGKVLGALVAVIGLTIGSVAMADELPFNGAWTGTGNTIYADDFKDQCTSINLVIEQSADAFLVKSGQFDCGLITEIWEPVSLTIKDGELFAQTNKVGTITDTEAHMRFDRHPGYVWEWTLTLKDGRMLVDETFIQNLSDGSFSTSRTWADLGKKETTAPITAEPLASPVLKTNGNIKSVRGIQLR